MHETAIVITAVHDHPKAWAFAYNTRAFVERGDFIASLVGNGPIVVPKSGGPAFLASSAESVGDQLDRL